MESNGLSGRRHQRRAFLARILAEGIREGIRTRGSPFKSRPHPLLGVSSLFVVGMAIALPYTSVGNWFGLIAPPVGLLLALAGMTAVYLVAVEYIKRWFYARDREYRAQ